MNILDILNSYALLNMYKMIKTYFKLIKFNLYELIVKIYLL
jgi:hypothetical protein